MCGGQFGWDGFLLKGNAGVQRFAQMVWQSIVECKGRSELYCKADRPSSCESRA